MDKERTSCDLGDHPNKENAYETDEVRATGVKTRKCTVRLLLNELLSRSLVARFIWRH